MYLSSLETPIDQIAVACPFNDFIKVPSFCQILIELSPPLKK
jgi:hypothetical protein